MTITLDASPIDVSPTPRPAWGTLASLGFHAALAGLLLLGLDKDAAKPVLPPSIAVELMTAAQFAALTAPAEIPPAAAPVAPAEASPGPNTATPAAKSAPGATIRATEFFAGSLLAEPESANLRQRRRMTTRTTDKGATVSWPRRGAGGGPQAAVAVGERQVRAEQRGLRQGGEVGGEADAATRATATGVPGAKPARSTRVASGVMWLRPAASRWRPRSAPRCRGRRSA